MSRRDERVHHGDSQGGGGVDARLRMARLWANRSQTDRAIYHYLKAAELLIEQGAPHDAHDVCCAALELDPDHAQVRQLMAHLQEEVQTSPHPSTPLDAEMASANELASLLSETSPQQPARKSRNARKTLERRLTPEEVAQLYARASQAEWFTPPLSASQPIQPISRPERPPSTQVRSIARDSDEHLTFDRTPTPRRPLPSPYMSDDWANAPNATTTPPTSTPDGDEPEEDSLAFDILLDLEGANKAEILELEDDAEILELEEELDDRGQGGYRPMDTPIPSAFVDSITPHSVASPLPFSSSTPSSDSWNSYHPSSSSGDSTTPPGWERISSNTLQARTRAFSEQPNPLWSSLPPDLLEQTLSHLRRVAPGEVLIDEGLSRKRDVGLYMVVQGDVELLLRRDAATPLQPLARLQAWDMFGEARLLNGRPSPLVARALTAVEVLAMPEIFVLSQLAPVMPGLMDMLRDTYHTHLTDTLLALHPILHTLPSAARDQLTVRRFDPGTTVVQHGRPFNNLYMVLQGRLMATQQYGIAVATLNSGDLFNGDAVTIDNPSSNVTVVTQDDTVLLEFSRNALIAIAEHQPDLIETLVEHMIAIQPSYGRHGIIQAL
ncbi:MAG: cyclic nucleotide-binding domain-containing protein [Myxococcota bacterium]